MALSPQGINEARRMLSFAEVALQQERDLELFDIRWNQNDMYNAFNNTDLSAEPEFSHLNQSEMGNAREAFALIRAVFDEQVGATGLTVRTILAMLKG